LDEHTLMKRTYETVHERFPDKQILCTEASGWGKYRTLSNA
jgi:hypothetical protein